jgi:hypothetical protein
MRNLISILFTTIIFPLLMASCKMDKIERAEIIGRWSLEENLASREKGIEIKNPTTFSFFEDCHFEAINVPAKPLYGLLSDSIHTISGTGRWKLISYQSNPAIELEFHDTKEYSKGFITQIYISKWFGKISLFIWLNEEGGDRVKFLREELKK